MIQPLMACRPMLSAVVVVGWFCARLGVAGAQEPTHRLTLRETVAHALARHPALATSAEEEAVGDARVTVARVEALPRIGVVGQINRSTGNVVPGATFPMTGIPTVAGPPGATRFGSGVWESAAGVTLGWDALELVRRPTLIAAAEKEAAATRAQTSTAKLLVETQAADAYLAVAQARESIAAASESEKRAATFSQVVATLVGQKLRPELDAARADTDLANARVLLERARLVHAVNATKLAEVIGETGWRVDVVETDVRDLPPVPPELKGVIHPALAAYRATADAAEARASAARLGYLPKIELLGAAWLRGSGYVLGGPNSGSGDGLVPDTPNWAVGLVASWTPTDIPIAAAKARVESTQAAVARAKANEIAEALSADEQSARASFASAVAIAQQTALEVAAARKARDIAGARYTSGLGNVLEVADAERALANAEQDDAVAKLEAWRAAVRYYGARGDVEPLFSGTRTKE